MDGDNFHRVKENLQEAIDMHDKPPHVEATVLPILHNGDHIFLLFSGWGIHLDINGTWHWECTLGG